MQQARTEPPELQVVRARLELLGPQDRLEPPALPGLQDRLEPLAQRERRAQLVRQGRRELLARPDQFCQGRLPAYPWPNATPIPVQTPLRLDTAFRSEVEGQASAAA